jgi:hypothetical protein
MKSSCNLTSPIFALEEKHIEVRVGITVIRLAVHVRVSPDVSVNRYVHVHGMHIEFNNEINFQGNGRIEQILLFRPLIVRYLAQLEEIHFFDDI